LPHPRPIARGQAIDRTRGVISDAGRAEGVQTWVHAGPTHNAGEFTRQFKAHRVIVYPPYRAMMQIAQELALHARNEGRLSSRRWFRLAR
jgi:hypothetical protein